MNPKLIQSTVFSSTYRQNLRNVLVHAPSIIWVDTGKKQLWWREQELIFDNKSWLLVPAGHYLTFINKPCEAKFRSRMLSFLSPPPTKWLAQTPAVIEPRIKPTENLSWCFEQLFKMPDLSLSAQKHLLYVLYAELIDIGALSCLFPAVGEPLKDRLSRYLSVNPGADHRLETVCEHFYMSRATMNRKLAAEGESFRDILTQVRMVYALSLLQQSRHQLDVALACGYQSQARFAARFKQMFGVTPKQYARTV